MAYLLNQKSMTKDQSCTCCGRPIRQLRDHQTMLLVLRGTLAQQRGAKCINCAEVICSKCSQERRRCICSSNAWIALPYLESVYVAATGQPISDEPLSHKVSQSRLVPGRVIA